MTWKCKRCGNTTFRKAWQLTKTNHRIIWRFCEGAICQYKEIDHIEPPISKPFTRINDVLINPSKSAPRFISIDGHLVKIE